MSSDITGAPAAPLASSNNLTDEQQQQQQQTASPRGGGAGAPLPPRPPSNQAWRWDLLGTDWRPNGVPSPRPYCSGIMDGPSNFTDNPVLRLECQTWNRDSHELYDYESRNVFVRNYYLRKSAKVFRSNIEIHVLPDGSAIPTNGDYLVSIKPRDYKYWVSPADRQTCNGTEALSARKLWLITKFLKDQKHILVEGDVMKLGRFKLRIKQIVANSTDVDVPVDYRLDDVEVPMTELTPEETASTQCRICLLEGAEDNDPLIRACQCKGSIMYVHLDCLRHWVNGRLNLSDDPSRTCCFIRQLPCELCKATFPSFVSWRGVRMPVVKIPKIEPPFIVLENVGTPANRGVHLCSLSAKKECKLGRGHESDVRIADVSISRWHATIKFADGAFQLEDQRSKFGTLVSLRKPIAVDGSEHVSVQVGRTVLRFSIAEDAPPMSQDIVKYVEASDLGAGSPNSENAEHGSVVSSNAAGADQNNAAAPRVPPPSGNSRVALPRATGHSVPIRSFSSGGAGGDDSAPGSYTPSRAPLPDHISNSTGGVPPNVNLTWLSDNDPPAYSGMIVGRPTGANSVIAPSGPPSAQASSLPAAGPWTLGIVGVPIRFASRPFGSRDQPAVADGVSSAQPAVAVSWEEPPGNEDLLLTSSRRLAGPSLF